MDTKTSFAQGQLKSLVERIERLEEDKKAIAGEIQHFTGVNDPYEPPPSPDVVVRELTRVKAAGLPVREEFSVDCCHANQDKFWVKDPDGVEWEVYHLNYDLEEETARPTGATFPILKTASCCAPSGAVGG